MSGKVACFIFRGINPPELGLGPIEMVMFCDEPALQLTVTLPVEFKARGENTL